MLEVQPAYRGGKLVGVREAEETACRLGPADFSIICQAVEGPQGKLVHVLTPDPELSFGRISGRLGIL